MPKDSALVTVQLLPSNFSNQRAFVSAVIKEVKAQAERVWKNRPAPTRQRRGRPSEQTHVEAVITETINERFWAVRASAEETRKAMAAGGLSQGKLIATIAAKMETRNLKEGGTSTPHQDTIYKYVKGHRLFSETDPHELTVSEAKWLAKHFPSRAKGILQLARIFEYPQIPEKIIQALATAEVSPPKK